MTSKKSGTTERSTAAPGTAAAAAENAPAGGLEKIEAAELAGNDPPNPGGTVIGGEGTASAQRAEAAGGDPLGAELPEGDAAVNTRTDTVETVDAGAGKVAADVDGGEFVADGETDNLPELNRRVAEGEEGASTSSARTGEGVGADITNDDRPAGELDQDFATAADPESVEGLRARVAELEAENDRLRNSIAGYKGQVTKARALAGGPETRTPRKVGCMDQVYTEEGRAEMREALREALGKGDVTLVASDGEREVTAFQPTLVDALPWQTRGARTHYTGEIMLEGLAGPENVEVAGFAALYDGKQIAWSPLADPIVVQPGTRVKVEGGTIAF